MKLKYLLHEYVEKSGLKVDVFYVIVISSRRSYLRMMVTADSSPTTNSLVQFKFHVQTIILQPREHAQVDNYWQLIVIMF